MSGALGLEDLFGALTLGELAQRLGTTPLQLLEQLAPLLLERGCARPVKAARSAHTKTQEVAHAGRPVERPARPGAIPDPPAAPTIPRLDTMREARPAPPMPAASVGPFVSTRRLGSQSHVRVPREPAPTMSVAQAIAEHVVEGNPEPPEPRVARQRAMTIAEKRITKGDIAVGRLLYPEAVEGRPRTRGECKNVCRPCPYVGCRYNLYLDVDERTGSVKFNRPELQPWNMPPASSCALDLADLGGHTLEETGAALNVTRERLRQIEERALDHLAVDYDPLTQPKLEDLVVDEHAVFGD